MCDIHQISEVEPYGDITSPMEKVAHSIDDSQEPDRAPWRGFCPDAARAVEQVQLVINLQAARAIEVEVPNAVQLLADELIE